MDDHLAACAAMGDEELITSLKRLVADERQSVAVVIAHLLEFDKRKLFSDEGQPSLFYYCTRVLAFSEAEAYRRIHTAHAVQLFPSILGMLERGEIHMEAVALLGPHLTGRNHVQLLDQARGKSKRDVEAMVADLAPTRDTPDFIRHLGPQPAAEEPADPHPSLLVPSEDPATTPAVPTSEPSAKVEPAERRIRFGFTGGEELLCLLRRAQDVLKHKYPAGDLECIFLDALQALLDKKDPDRRIAAKEERRGPIPQEPEVRQSPYAALAHRIPQAVRDAVWRRDGGQCVYANPAGERCPERGGLEYDHIVPWALGGPSNNPKNIRLLCKAHNQMMGRRVFGDERFRRRTPGGSWAGPDPFSPGP